MKRFTLDWNPRFASLPGVVLKLRQSLVGAYYPQSYLNNTAVRPSYEREGNIFEDMFSGTAANYDCGHTKRTTRKTCAVVQFP
jgi:hypothetical protein